MKEINDQLYGYSYELDQTTEEDLTTCYAVDTGTIFIAYKGVWYEQRSFWAAQLSPSDDDILGLSYEVNKTTPASDLTVFNAVDTGVRYVSFNGAWYAQPVQWSAPAAGGGGGSELPDPTEANDGDVLTVDDGAWVAAAPGGGGGGSDVLVVHEITVDENIMRLDKTMGEIINAMPLVYLRSESTSPVGGSTTVNYDQFFEYEFTSTGNYFLYRNNGTYSAASLDDYPTTGGGQ